jgi:hypothetical protein
MASCINLDKLLAKMNKSRTYKEQVKRFGSSRKAQDFQSAIDKLNSQFGTSFYMDREGKTFHVSGHREFGHLSRRSGLLGKDITMTLGGNELTEDSCTIKMIVDDNNNFIVVSISKMKEIGLLSNESLSLQKGIHLNDSRFFYEWSLDQMKSLGCILYSSGV